MSRLKRFAAIVRLSAFAAATLGYLNAACSGQSAGQSGAGPVDAMAGSSGAGSSGAGSGGTGSSGAGTGGTGSSGAGTGGTGSSGAGSGVAVANGAGGDAGSTTGTEELRLPTVDGSGIAAEAPRCIYRQAVGADDTLSLQLQFLTTANTLAFAVYVDNPKPATPYDGRAGEDGSFQFEAYVGELRYASALSQSEITVHLETLPSPADLQEGQDIALRGTLWLTRFDAPEVNASGDVGPTTLQVAPGAVSIACTASFQKSQVFN